MNFILILILTLGINAGKSVVLGENCDKYGVLVYEDLGCVPENDNLDDCPVKYECKGLEQWNNKCHFNGKIYSDKEIVDDKMATLSCDVACFCDANLRMSRFICAVLDCPEWLGKKISSGCYNRYSLDGCCSNGQICYPSHVKCIVDGIEYKEHERFYPKNTCLKCVCQKGFTGKLEAPFCKRLSCGAQLKHSIEIQNNCAPVYRKVETEDVLCCPAHWICPMGNEEIKSDQQTGNFCKFGSIYLSIGQSFKSFQHMAICKCIIPPLVTCILERNILY